jgi:hypothetical protein
LFRGAYQVNITVSASFVVVGISGMLGNVAQSIVIGKLALLKNS